MRTVPISLALLALAMALPGPAMAQQRLKAGLWEHAVTIQSASGEADAALAKMQQQLASMPPDQRKMVEQMMAKQGVAAGAKPNTVRICLSQEQVDRDDMPRQQGCTQTIKRSGNVLNVAFQCQGPPPTSGEGEVTIASPTAYSGRFQTRSEVQGKPQTMTMKQSGQWVGADCGALKPIGR